MRRLHLFLFAALFLAPLFPARAAETAAVFPDAQPYPEASYEHRIGIAPAQQIFVARVDLSDPNVDVRAAPGDIDPDGDGEYQTVLRTPTTIANHEHFEIAINGDFFTAHKVVDIEGEKSGFVTGVWAKAIGPAVTDGFLWAPSSEPRAALIFDAQKKPRIAMTKDVPPDALQIIAGSNVLLERGKIVVEGESGFSKARHPRTAVGIGADGKTLVLVVVDGRRAGKAAGISLTELAQLMQSLGCRDALNLDGGGSSEMVMRDPKSGVLQVLNTPSDGRERAVANVLGVSIRGTRRAPRATPK